MNYSGAQEDALHNINLHVEEKAMLFVAGRSGAGKSSLLKIIALIDKHSKGQVIVNGYNLSRVKSSQIPFFRRNIGFMFQDHRLIPERTVFDNVALPLVVCGYRHTEMKKRVQAALDKVNLLSKMNSYPLSLSGGEQQRVGVARAVVHRPAILLADEPTGNLDPMLSLDTMRLFEQFNQVGVTVLIASHDMDMLKKLKKPIITLRQGRLIN